MTSIYKCGKILKVGPFDFPCKIKVAAFSKLKYGITLYLFQIACKEI